MNDTPYTIERGPRIHTWGGWYQHDIVKVDGKEIGRMQLKRRPNRPHIETITCGPESTCVVGYNLDWLLRVHREGFPPQ